MSIKVNTDALRHTAAQVHAQNCRIRDAFSDVDSAISRLERGWRGTNGENALKKLRSTKLRCQDDRYQSIVRLTDFLNRAADDRYDAAETARSRAASAFK